MNDYIFFNPADSIANIHDADEAVRKAHILKNTKDLDKELVVVRGTDNQEFAIFYADREVAGGKDNQSKEYHLEKRI